MKLQQKTLARYRQLFPKDTLREISARTGIQITRVFRLFNGKTMKVGELEAFEAVIAKKLGSNTSFERLSDVIDSAATVLSSEELARITDYVHRKISIKTLSRNFVTSDAESAVIA